jgi:hypothetical protein
MALSLNSPFSAEHQAKNKDERFLHTIVVPPLTTAAEDDERLIKQVMEEQRRLNAVKKKIDKEEKRKRRQKRARARVAKEKSIQAGKDELAATLKLQHATHPPKKRLSALERETMKRYGLYTDGINEMMHKDEGVARPVSKLLDLLVERIHRRQSTSSRVESFKIFLPNVNNRGKITKSSLREGIRAVGLTYTDDEANLIFEQVDKNGDGDIDYSEFVQALMGDKPQMLRNVSSDMLDKLRGAQKRQLQMLRHMGQDGSGNRWAIGQAKAVLLKKIEQKVKGGQGQARRAFRYFQDSLDKNGVNINSFQHGLREVGMIVPADMQWVSVLNCLRLTLCFLFCCCFLFCYCCLVLFCLPGLVC